MPKNVNLAQSWSLRNDQIVLLALSGTMNQRELGEAFGISHQQISNILSDPRAEEIITVARTKLQEHLVKDIEDQLDLASQAAVRVIKRTLDADIAPKHRAKSNQDRVAIATLRGRGYLKEEGKGGDSGFQVPAEQFNAFMEAMKKADKAQEINPFEGQEVLEAELVEVEDGSDNQPV